MIVQTMDKRDTMAVGPDIPRLFDYMQHCRNRARAAPSFNEFHFLKSESAFRLADRLELVRRDFPLCLDFGCHDGLLTSYLEKTGKVKTVIQSDPTFEFARLARAKGPAIVVFSEI